MMDNYTISRNRAQQYFLGFDQEKILRRWAFRHDDHYIFLRFLGVDYQICRHSGQVLRLPQMEEAEHGEVLSIFDLMCHPGKNTTVESNVYLVHQFAEVVPGLLDAKRRRLHRNLSTREARSILRHAVHNNARYAAGRQYLIVDVGVKVILEQVVHIRLNELGFCKHICRRNAGAVLRHGRFEQSVKSLQVVFIRQEVSVLGWVAILHMEERMHHHIQGRVFVVRNHGLFLKRNLRRRDNRYGISQPVFFDVLQNKSPHRIQLDPLFAVYQCGRHFGGIALHPHPECFILNPFAQRIAERLITKVNSHLQRVELNNGFARHHDVTYPATMGRLCDQVSVFFQVDEHLSIFIVLIEYCPHLVT